MPALDHLAAIDFHDLPVKGIRYHLEYPFELAVDFVTYDEARKTYDDWTIRFIGVESLSNEGLRVRGTSSFEISSFSYKNEESFEGVITLLGGFGEPSMTIEVKCKECRLERAASGNLASERPDQEA